MKARDKLTGGRGHPCSGLLWRLTALAAVGVLTLVACGGGASETATDDGNQGGDQQAEQTSADQETQEMTSVHMGMATASIAVPGPWVADILGFYEDEGLDVRITTSDGSVATTQQAITGQYDLIYASTDALLEGIDSSGSELHPFFNVFYKEFRDWIVPADSEIESIADLQGTTIGVSDLAGGEMPLVRFLLRREGIDPDEDVDIVAVGAEPAAIVTAFEAGRIDSMARTVVITVALRAQDFPIRSIMPGDVAEGAVEGVWATADLAEDTDLLARFARATAEGTLFCIESIDACLDAIGTEYPERVEDRDVARQTLEAFVPLITPPTEGDRLRFGPLGLEDINRVVDIYGSGEDASIADPEALKQMMNDLHIGGDDFTAEINDFDYEAVVEFANSYEPE